MEIKLKIVGKDKEWADTLEINHILYTKEPYSYKYVLNDGSVEDVTGVSNTMAFTEAMISIGKYVQFE